MNDMPAIVYLCSRIRNNFPCLGVLSFLGTGSESVFEPTPDRPFPYCVRCGSRDMGQRYEIA